MFKKIATWATTTWNKFSAWYKSITKDLNLFCKLVKITTPIAFFAIAAWDLPWLAGIYCIFVLAEYAFQNIK